MQVGSNVRCFFTMRRSKAYARFGTPARDGDEGKVISITELKDTTIVQFETADGVRQCHICNLIEK